MKVNIPNINRKSSKIKVKIDPWDTWSLDTTLAPIIFSALLQLKNNKLGVPTEFADVGGDGSSRQYAFDFYDESYSDAFDVGLSKWKEALDKMIWAFYQVAFDNYSSKYHHGEMEIDWKELDETTYNPFTKKNEKLYEMVDMNPGDHWYDQVGQELHEKRIQEGLELFGKYYRALWD